MKQPKLLVKARDAMNRRLYNNESFVLMTIYESFVLMTIYRVFVISNFHFTIQSIADASVISGTSRRFFIR